MTSKRERELARAKYERQLERRTQREAREKMLKLVVSGVLVVLVAVGIGLANRKTTTASPAVSTSPTSTASTSANPVSGCQDAGPNRPDDMKFAKVPANAKAGSALVLETNCGILNIALNKSAPKTTAAMSFLTNRGFFNQTQCHRLTTQGIYVLQCGDPTATGSGGPGFSFKDENLPKSTGSSAIYKRGIVAMANSGANTNGSQFFLVYKDSPLPPNYSVWGKIVGGLGTLEKVAAAGVAGGGADGQPNQRVVIGKASVTP